MNQNALRVQRTRTLKKLQMYESAGLRNYHLFNSCTATYKYKMAHLFLSILTLLGGLSTIGYWFLRQENFYLKHGKKAAFVTLLYLLSTFILFFYHPETTPVGLLYLLVTASISILYKNRKWLISKERAAFDFLTFTFLFFSVLALLFMNFKNYF
jgi:hypothetical protein